MLVSTILLPAVVASQILWNTLTEQIYAGYEKRLASGLQTFELVLNSTYRTLQDTVSRTGADNTMRITMELEILPQLLRYLQSQVDVSSIDFLTVTKPDGTPFLIDTVGANNRDLSGRQCNFSQNGAVDNLSMFGDTLVLSRSYPINHKGRILGFICGGVLLNTDFFLGQLEDALGALPSMWHKGVFVPSPLFGRQTVSLQFEPGQMFDYRPQSGHFKGMLSHIKIGTQPLTIGVMITLEKLKQGFEKAIVSILLAFLMIAVVVILALRYLTMQRKTQAQLLMEQERAMVTLSSIGDAVLTTDVNGRISYLNVTAEKLIGYGIDDLKGKTWDEQFRIRNEETGALIPSPVDESLATGKKIVAPTSSVLVLPDGRETAVHYTAAPIGDLTDRNNGVVLVLRDVGQERRLQRELTWKASRDDLTGLFNRTEFRHRLYQAIESARERKLEHCLLYLDLDQFKVVNDSCGHRVGDQLLMNLSALLKVHLRSIDTLSRLGGDEFGILLEGCPQKEAMDIAEALRETMGEYRFSHGDKVFDISASIGMVVINEHSTDAEDLMSLVDSACYTAKELGRNRIHISEYTNEISDYRLQEMEWATRIKDALKAGRFQLFFQPIVPIAGAVKDRAPHHGEILVRMVDSDGSLISPGSFIPAAERYGLMTDIDRWVVNELFRTEKPRYQALGRRLRRGSREPACLYTINLSGASVIEPGFLEYVKQQMHDHEIPPQLVCFELTETVAVTHMDRAITFMRELKAMGCRFLLDDFGSGMSSFGYLKQLPVDYVKIDGLFVKDILKDPIDRGMVKAINEIAHTMGLGTVAEFVENDDILKELYLLGVDYAQGYGISPPRPLPKYSDTPPTTETVAAGSFNHCGS